MSNDEAGPGRRSAHTADVHNRREKRRQHAVASRPARPQNLGVERRDPISNAVVKVPHHPDAS
jgi:hypothetical protein